MTDAIVTSTPVTAPGRGKGLMEQETPVANGEVAEDFAALVDAYAPAAATATAAIDGTVLPAIDQTLPPTVEVETDPGLNSGFDLADGLASLAPAVPGVPAASRAPEPAAVTRAGFGREGMGALRDPAVSRRAAGGEVRDAGGAITTDGPDTAAGTAEVPDFLAALAASQATAEAPTEVSRDANAAAVNAPPSQAEPLLAGAATAGHGARGDTARLTLDSQLPVLGPQFAERFSEQVSVLVNHGVKSALLSLNPAELGPIDVRISLVNDEAHVQIASAHGVVRDVVNDALPKLREMFEAAGMRLGDSGVFSELPQQQPQPGPGFMPRAAASDWQAPVEETLLIPRRALSLVDAYA